MIVSTNDLLESVGVILIKNGVHGINGILSILIQIHVILFIDSFKFRMESADHEIAETVSLNTCPVVYLV